MMIVTFDIVLLVSDLLSGLLLNIHEKDGVYANTPLKK